jgi:hypothetical protein
MLKYLFRVYFADCDYEQTPEDRATIAPQGSAFSDVMHLERGGHQLVAFALVDAATGESLAAVHLDTGHFELGGHEFYAGADGLDDPTIERRVIYYRQVRQIREQDMDTTTGEPVGAWRESTHTRYVIGWQATLANGRNVQHVIALDG